MSRALPRLALVVALLIAALPLAAGVAGAQGKALSASRVQLPNGLTVLVRENPTAPVVAFSLMTRMGTRSENEGNAGISNFLQLMLVRGTTSKNGVETPATASFSGSPSPVRSAVTSVTAAIAVNDVAMRAQSR